MKAEAAEYDKAGRAEEERRYALEKRVDPHEKKNHRLFLARSRLASASTSAFSCFSIVRPPGFEPELPAFSFSVFFRRRFFLRKGVGKLECYHYTTSAQILY